MLIPHAWSPLREKTLEADWPNVEYLENYCFDCGAQLFVIRNLKTGACTITFVPGCPGREKSDV